MVCESQLRNGFQIWDVYILCGLWFICATLYSCRYMLMVNFGSFQLYSYWFSKEAKWVSFCKQNRDFETLCRKSENRENNVLIYIHISLVIKISSEKKLLP